MIKKYKSIYENYEYSSISDDMREKEFIDHNPKDDYEDRVNEIRIIDIKYEDEEYFNLHRKIGGNPRLSSKSGTFSAFAEESTAVNVRSYTENGKTSVIYTPKPGYFLKWVNEKVDTVFSLDIHEIRSVIYNSPYKVLLISAKNLKLSDKRNKNRQAKARSIRKMGKVKYTSGKNG